MITKSKMKAIVDAIVSIRDNISDNQALTAVAIYPDWKIDVNYTAGTRVVFNGVLYKVLQNHISQETWTPIDAPSLFAKVLIPDENIISIWEQPDSTNAYMKDDKVVHNDKVWKSLIDNNVWEPGAIGTESLWIEIVE